MSSALIATVSFGCILLTSLVLADLRRDFKNVAFNKGSHPWHRRGTHGNHRNKGGNFGAKRVYFPFSGEKGSPKVVDPYKIQPGYVDNKAGNTVYNGYSQGNDLYVNKGANAGAQSVTYPSNENQGIPKVVNPYNNLLGDVGSKPGNDAYGNQQGIDKYLVQGAKGGDVYKVSDPYVVNQGRFTTPDPYKNQQDLTTNYPNVKNDQELGQYSNQDNKGSNVGAYTATIVTDGKQGGSQGINLYNNQPGNIVGTIDKDTYNKQLGNIGGIIDKDAYNNQPGNIGGINNKDTYNNQPSTIGGIIDKDAYNNQPGNIGGIIDKDTYNNQPGNSGGFNNKDAYNNQPSTIGGIIDKDTYNNQPGNIGGINNKDTYNNQPSTIGGIIDKDTYNNQPGNIGGINNKDAYNNQPSTIGRIIDKDTYNNQPGNIGGIIDKETYNKNNNILSGTTVYNNAP